MKKRMGIIVIIIGFFIVGIGTYIFFEEYNNYLKEENNKKNIIKASDSLVENSITRYNGEYKNEGKSISIKTINNNTIYAVINNEGVELSYNDGRFENSSLDLFIEFEDNVLTIYENGFLEKYYK